MRVLRWSWFVAMIACMHPCPILLFVNTMPGMQCPHAAQPSIHTSTSQFQALREANRSFAVVCCVCRQAEQCRA